MAQELKSDAKSDNLSLIPEIPYDRRRGPIPESCSMISIYVPWHTYAHTYKIDKYKLKIKHDD